MIKPFALSLVVMTAAAQAAEIPLYPTGPSEDSSFVRFANGGAQSLQLIPEGSKTQLTLEGDKAVSDYLPVAAGQPIKGTLVSDGKKYPMELTVQPGEFATVVGLPGKDGLTQVNVSETPEDFNGLKASLAFYSLDESCKDAGLLAAGRNAAIFKSVPNASLQRRDINPVSLSVQLSCAGTPTGAPLDLGTLVAGERYSVFLLPSAQGSRLLKATDTLAH
jgi:hypothetical protein